MREVKTTLARLEPMIVRIDAILTATLPHLATKAELADLRSEMTGELSALRGSLADKPGKAYLWGVLAVLIAAYAAGLAGLAVLH